MKKIWLVLICSGLGACATTDPTVTRSIYIEDTITGPRTRYFNPLPPLPPIPRPCRNRDLVQQELNQRQIEAAQMNELMGGVYGPNNRYSASLLDYQNHNREVKIGRAHV